MSDYDKIIFKKPTGSPPKAPANEDRALRFNEGKLRESLFPVEVMEEMLRVLEAGAKKYGDHNWQKGLPYMEVYDSLTRHLRSFRKGEDLDPEDQALHIAKVAINAVFLAYYQLKGMSHFDDRGKK